jgi:hypothetical protein
MIRAITETEPDAFTAAMLAAGWLPERDVFGAVVAWRHRSGRRVADDVARGEWQRLGVVLPF